MKQELKNVSETRAIVQSLNEKIAKLTRARDLLADAGILALVKQVLQTNDPRASVGSESDRAKSGTRGAIVRAAHEAVLAMGDDLFTKSELAGRLRRAGYERKRAKNAMFYAVQRLVAENVIELVQRGGGKRANVYRRVNAALTPVVRLSTQQPGETDEASTSGVPFPKQIKPKNEMERFAFDCIARFDQPFGSHELIRNIVAAGYPVRRR